MSDWEDDVTPTTASNEGGSSWGGFGVQNEGSSAPRGRGRGRGGQNRDGGGGSFGGVGGGAGGGRGCFNCGEEGHRKMDCPNPRKFDGGGGSRGCHLCGEDGHMKRDCPKNTGGGGGSRGCHNCGESGHMKRECPQLNGTSNNNAGGDGGFSWGDDFGNSDNADGGGFSSGGGFGSSGGGGGGGRGCFNCGEEGHRKSDCPNPPKENGRGGGGNACFNCGEEGHRKGDCPNPAKENGRSGGSGCFNCGEEGHMKSECTNPAKPRLDADGNEKPPAQTYVPVEMDEAELFDQGVSAGTGFEKFDKVAVKVSGDPPLPKNVENFSETNLRGLLLENIKRAGYDKPLPVQKHAIPIIMSGRDLMSCAQTGSGKTAAFLLPILHYIIENDSESFANEESAQPTALVIAPTRELVIQIYNEARKFAHQSVVKVCCVYGGTSVMHQRRALQRGCHILVATPGRLLDYAERSHVSFASLKFLVLDEADRMLDMGFKNCIEKIIENPNTPAQTERQTLMFSATFPEEIQQLAKTFLKDYVFIVTGMIGSANEDVVQTLLQVESSGKREALLNFIQESLDLNKAEKILVFVETKRMADFIASYLSDKGVSCTSIHGDRFQSQREEALRQFTVGQRSILVATAVAARGLDIKGVGIVLNYDMPKELDEYVHRIGRTGRVGNAGKAVSYFDTTKDGHLAKDLVKLLSDAENEVPEWLIECAHSSGGVSSYQGSNTFGASDIRSKVNTQNFDSGPTFSQGAVAAADDDESWD